MCNGNYLKYESIDNVNKNISFSEYLDETYLYSDDYVGNKVSKINNASKIQLQLTLKVIPKSSEDNSYDWEIFVKSINIVLAAGRFTNN